MIAYIYQFVKFLTSGWGIESNFDYFIFIFVSLYAEIS